MYITRRGNVQALYSIHTQDTPLAKIILIEVFTLLIKKWKLNFASVVRRSWLVCGWISYGNDKFSFIKYCSHWTAVSATQELGSIPEDREEAGKKATVDIGKRKNNWDRFIQLRLRTKEVAMYNLSCEFAWVTLEKVQRDVLIFKTKTNRFQKQYLREFCVFHTVNVNWNIPFCGIFNLHIAHSTSAFKEVFYIKRGNRVVHLFSQSYWTPMFICRLTIGNSCYI